MAKLKDVMEKLKRRLFPKSAGGVPEDVKEGRFAVHAVKVEKYQRFIVELAHLSKPEFLEVLESAEEEFGFEQSGVLVVPCHPTELAKILVPRSIERACSGGDLRKKKATTHYKFINA